MELTDSNHSSIPLPQLEIRRDQPCRKQNRSDNSDDQIWPSHPFVIWDLSNVRMELKGWNQLSDYTYPQSENQQSLQAAK